MKKVIFATFSVLLLVGCSELEETKPEPVKDDKVEQVVEEEEVEETEETVKEEPVAEEEKDTPVITFVEFDKKYTRDSDVDVYMDGLFQLKDGERVNADYVWYVDGGFFDYASAIFIDGNLASLKVATTKPIADIEKGLGIPLENVSVDPTRNGYEIVFDERFHTDNIRVYPNEWD